MKSESTLKEGLYMSQREIPLRYGCNPHQIPARIYVKAGELPIRVLNGKPGYINLLDAMNSWQLVKELRQATGLAGAASFKHVSPAGAAVGIPLQEELRAAYHVDGMELSPLACAYARARGADRMSSFGDWVAVSDPVDLPTAEVLRREVSHGIIAPAYHSEALEMLRRKRKGEYVIIEVDPTYEPERTEMREVFGIAFEQRRNDAVASEDWLRNIVTRERELPDPAKRDLLVALTALKYTQSNSVCFAYDGQVIGMGAGQQSRIHCTRLAAEKAEKWYLRQHASVLSLQFRKGVGRPERDNAIDQFLLDSATGLETSWSSIFENVPGRLTREEKTEWLATLKGVCLASDGFFPFRDNIDRAHESGVKFVVQPGGSLRDEEVVEACNEHAMVMAFSGVRLFHH